MKNLYVENISTEKVYQVYDIRYDLRITWFLIYEDNEWRWKSAILYRPISGGSI